MSHICIISRHKLLNRVVALQWRRAQTRRARLEEYKLRKIREGSKLSALGAPSRESSVAASTYDYAAERSQEINESAPGLRRGGSLNKSYNNSIIRPQYASHLLYASTSNGQYLARPRQQSSTMDSSFSELRPCFYVRPGSVMSPAPSTARSILERGTSAPTGQCRPRKRIPSKVGGMVEKIELEESSREEDERRIMDLFPNTRPKSAAPTL